MRTVVHNYTLTQRVGRYPNNQPAYAHSHFATSHGGAGSQMLSGDTTQYIDRPQLAGILRYWRALAATHPDTATLTRGVSGYI